MNKRNLIIGIIALGISLICLIPASAAGFSPQNDALPDYFDFSDNYYTAYGGPDVSATIVGDNEFYRGDSVTLNINLMNKGVITGFRSEKDDDPVDVLDQKLQQEEMSYESQRTTAIGIVAILTSPDPNVEVKSGPQEAGSLATGEQTTSPVKFNIDFSNNAPSGDYPLILSLYYGYQKNVQVSGDNETSLGVTNMDVGLWYDVGSQNVTIPVNVKREAQFEVTNVSGQLAVGEEGMLHVTYTNTGNEPVKDAIVRISAANPFSTTDDQAYLGDLDAGESAVAVFKLKVGDSAVEKPYAINSEIKYEDTKGHDRVSDNVKIKTQVSASSNTYTGGLMLPAGFAIAALVIGAIVLYMRRKPGQKPEE
ncbi:COG1361 S-layer family protein [Methanohalophilus mahii]|uniref:S-layer-like domain-containing protein n=1 Tax=Methanohalophilus mahii (strain ATCC 35705 / DSM 5219 / SLP) TaxID=547558 RepID=D5EA14_METMS|nr:hypothetical protein [Methanohalophilus mahii]ADE36015.1 hypothetical protein Mmah_0487 [Methanohalophilus mahii DSM 5219]